MLNHINIKICFFKILVYKNVSIKVFNSFIYSFKDLYILGWPLFLNSRIFDFSPPPHFVHYYKKVIFVKFDHDCSLLRLAQEG